MAEIRCCLCQGAEWPLIEKGCACSGNSSLVHPDCLAKQAERQAKEKKYDAWSTCDACKEKFTGRTRDKLAERMKDLGIRLHKMGNYRRAQKILRRVYKEMQEVFGAKHHKTLMTASHLAECFYDDGEYTKAEKKARRVVGGFQKVLPPGDPDLLTSKIFLAKCLYVQVKYREAEQIQRDVLKTQKKLMGLKDAGTRQSAKDLACTLKALGEYEEAYEIVREVHLTETELLGPENPNTVKSAHSLEFLSHRLDTHDGQQARQQCSGGYPSSPNKRKRREQPQLKATHKAKGDTVCHKKQK
jgi:tetratricopeptide (TPR) repeat protein